MSSEKYDVIIIGSGMGGLGAGITLLKSNPNLKVLIIEQHSIPGGYVNGFTRKGYYFDSGAEGIICAGKNQKFGNVLKKLDINQEFLNIL